VGHDELAEHGRHRGKTGAGAPSRPSRGTARAEHGRRWGRAGAGVPPIGDHPRQQLFRKTTLVKAPRGLGYRHGTHITLSSQLF
jgi:hypothetical protein